MKTILSAAIGAMLALSAVKAGAQAKAAERKVEIAIEQQSLADALNEWAKQTGLQLVSQSSEKMNTTVPPRLKGEYTAQGALDELLKGTTLTYEWVSERAVAIREKPLVVPAALQTSGVDQKQATVPVARFSGEAWGERRVAASAQTSAGAVKAERKGGKEDTDSLDAVEEIVVTGTHIRGLKVGPSPVQVLTREDIARSGFTTTTQVLRSVAANFGGGIGLETRQSGVLTQHGGQNLGFASSPNLRGLGSDATLVLLNGHRLPVASEGYSSDISAIPVAIIDRIEILKDGASAIYGSDAVAGVVNIITKREFETPQTTLVGSGVTSGDKKDIQASQLLGTRWNAGSAWGSYTYDRQDSLKTSSRKFSEGAPEPSVLTPSMSSHSIYAAAAHNISDGLRLSADALWGHKRNEEDSAFDFGEIYVTSIDSSVDSLIATARADFAFGNDWESAVTALFASDETRIDSAENLIFPASNVRYRGKNYSLEPKFDGPIATLPAGLMRMAVGGSYRYEEFRKDNNSNTGFDLDRKIGAAYAELFIPMYSSENRRYALEMLELTLSGRYEDYSDFGSSTNPKVGVLWSPLAGVALRATFARSFRAPLMAELQESDAGDLLFVFPDPLSPTGESLTLYRGGGNPNLDPQTAESFNFGITLDPESVPGFHAEITYFDIRYRDRIQAPGEGAVQIQLEPEVYGSFLTRNPSVELVNSLTSGPRFINAYGPFEPTDVVLIADARRTNLSTLNVDGIDLGARFTSSGSRGELALSLDASYFLHYEESLVAGQPGVVRRNTPYYPASLRLRTGANWSTGPWSLGGFFNYVNEYTDERDPLNPVTIDAWPTVDVQIAYAPATSRQSLREGAAISLSILNVFDREPPFVLNPNPAFSTACCQNYDAANASPLGRYVALRLTKAW